MASYLSYIACSPFADSTSWTTNATASSTTLLHLLLSYTFIRTLVWYYWYNYFLCYYNHYYRYYNYKGIEETAPNEAALSSMSSSKSSSSWNMSSLYRQLACLPAHLPICLPACPSECRSSLCSHFLVDWLRKRECYPLVASVVKLEHFKVSRMQGLELVLPSSPTI